MGMGEHGHEVSETCNGLRKSLSKVEDVSPLKLKATHLFWQVSNANRLNPGSLVARKPVRATFGLPKDEDA